MKKRETIYFDHPGAENTQACVEVVSRLINDGYKYVVVASTTGQTGLKIVKSVRGKPAKVVVVPLPAGFREPSVQMLTPAVRSELESLGASVHVGTIPTGGLTSALAEKYQGVYPAQIVAETLWRFGQGVKVAIEIVMMACDGGHVPEGEEVIAVGGTSMGADAVVVVKSTSTRRFHRLQVLEIAAKPREG